MGERKHDMAAPIQVEAAVSPEGKIEISVPELAPGQRVRVSIQPEEAPAEEQRPAREILGEAPGHQLFKTAEEVDAYIRDERDSWDR
jgi:hypothetical protein